MEMPTNLLSVDAAGAQRETVELVLVARLLLVRLELLGQRARVPHGVVRRGREQRDVHARELALAARAVEPVLLRARALVGAHDALVLRGIAAALRRAPRAVGQAAELPHLGDLHHRHVELLGHLWELVGVDLRHVLLNGGCHVEDLLRGPGLSVALAGLRVAVGALTVAHLLAPIIAGGHTHGAALALGAIAGHVVEVGQISEALVLLAVPIALRVEPRLGRRVAGLPPACLDTRSAHLGGGIVPAEAAPRDAGLPRSTQVDLLLLDGTSVLQNLLRLGNLLQNRLRLGNLRVVAVVAGGRDGAEARACRRGVAAEASGELEVH
eukprot:scaffold110675_cov63-Phaeocystis_antarctica.AAC.3